MKSVLISIQPKWCELIASGKKTVEVRKTKPKLETPFKVYIYCTDKKPSDNEWQYKPNLYLDKVENKVRWIDVEFTRTYNCEYLQQRIIGEFVCDEIFPIRVFENGTIQDYNGHAMERSCVPYDDISEYIGNNKTGYGWHISDLVIYDEPKPINAFVSVSTLNTNCLGQHLKRLDRPPQSWRYVEESEVKE